MHLFLQQLTKCKVDIIFYDNRKFSFRNQTTYNIIGINITTCITGIH